MRINSEVIDLSPGQQLDALLVKVATHRGHHFAIMEALDRSTEPKVSVFLEGQINKINQLVLFDEIKITNILNEGYKPNSSQIDLALRCELSEKVIQLFTRHLV